MDFNIQLFAEQNNRFMTNKYNKIAIITKYSELSILVSQISEHSVYLHNFLIEWGREIIMKNKNLNKKTKLIQVYQLIKKVHLSI